MGMDAEANDSWKMVGSAAERIRTIAAKIESPNADRVYVAKEYTLADLRRDLLATVQSGRE